VQLFSTTVVLSTKHKQNIEIMKTSIKTLIATGMIALALTSSTVYANGSNPIQQSVRDISVKAIKKLMISGNIEVTIIQQPKSKIAFTNEGTSDVVFTRVGDILKVSPKNADASGKVTIYIDDIYRIEASGNAVVKTNDGLTLKYLQVFLKGNASLDLNAKTESLYTVMENQSELKLKGSTESHTISMERFSRVTLDNFTAAKTEMNSSDVYVAARI
jgi:hypothetical protein